MIMTIFEFLRNQVFWIMDLLRGAQVKKAYDLLDNCESGKWTESEIAEYQEKQLTFLLQHVKTTVPYYMEKPYSDISNWPVVSKTIIKDILQYRLKKNRFSIGDGPKMKIFDLG